MSFKIKIPEVIFISAVMALLSCDVNNQQVPAETDDLVFRQDFFNTPAQLKQISFESCDTSLTQAIRRYLRIPDSGAIECSPRLPDKSLIVRAGDASCNADYCRTYFFQPMLKDGTLIGTRIPDTRGDFYHVPRTSANNSTFLTTDQIKNLPWDKNDPKFVAAKDDDWNYRAEFQRHGNRTFNISALGIALLAIDSIELPPHGKE